MTQKEIIAPLVRGNHCCGIAITMPDDHEAYGQSR